MRSPAVAAPSWPEIRHVGRETQDMVRRKPGDERRSRVFRCARGLDGAEVSVRGRSELPVAPSSMPIGQRARTFRRAEICRAWPAPRGPAPRLPLWKSSSESNHCPTTSPSLDRLAGIANGLEVVLLGGCLDAAARCEGDPQKHGILPRRHARERLIWRAPRRCVARTRDRRLRRMPETPDTRSLLRAFLE